VYVPALADGFALAGYGSAGAATDWSAALLDDPVLEAFKRAAIAHLKQSETAILAFREATPELATGREMRNGLRQLLSTTRLLISSPISSGTQYRGVLQDLELVFMKMAMTTPGTFASDLTQIETTLERRRLLPRMRALVPQPTGTHAN
jgi:hypothetical protein